MTRAFRELLAYREIILILIWRDLKTRYRGSVLGFLWTFLNPLMSGARIEDEGLFLVQHKYWQEAMQRALAGESNLKAK